MKNKELKLPNNKLIKDHAIQSLKRYWQSNSDLIKDLPIQQKNSVEINNSLELVEIKLPPWAESFGVNGVLLVPVESVVKEIKWDSVDWWLAIFLLMECYHERKFEESNGPIHSYSFRLKEWDQRVWDYAWVNRIALFLRCWAGKLAEKKDNEIFGNLPEPKILVTHDVDAIKKTIPIRIKQSIFNIYNALRMLRKGNLNKAYFKFKSALRFLFTSEDWWMLDEMLNEELELGVKSRYHFYANPKKTLSLKRWFFDPGYDINQSSMHNFFQKMIKNNYEIGIHPSFKTWSSKIEILHQVNYLSKVSMHPIKVCRQHWLRFSWFKTWKAQLSAGIEKDTTLMFNDRPGFRNGSAIAWNPFHFKSESKLDIEALPTLMMDSHFYDYNQFTNDERYKNMKRWIKECKDTHGEVAVLWHPHTLTIDYGWKSGFSDLLKIIME